MAVAVSHKIGCWRHKCSYFTNSRELFPELMTPVNVSVHMMWGSNEEEREMRERGEGGVDRRRGTNRPLTTSQHNGPHLWPSTQSSPGTLLIGTPSDTSDLLALTQDSYTPRNIHQQSHWTRCFHQFGPFH